MSGQIAQKKSAKPVKALTTTSLFFYFKEKGSLAIKASPSLHNDVKTLTFQVSIAQGKNNAFLFDSADAAAPAQGAIKYYKDPAKYPTSGDCFFHLWEVDRFKAPAKSTIEKLQFSAWHVVEDSDTSNQPNNDNDHIGYVQGFIAKVTDKVSKKSSFEFICLDDTGLTSPTTPEQPCLNFCYMKKGSDGKVIEYTKKVLIPGEMETIWELGIVPTTSAKLTADNDWTKKEYPYPIFYVESIRNLVYSQMKEGGLTIAFHTGLLVDEDHLTREKFNYYSKQIDTQMNQSFTAAYAFLQQLRTRVASARATAKLAPLTTAQESAAWISVEKECLWRCATLRFGVEWKDQYKYSQEDVPPGTSSWKSRYEAWVSHGRSGPKPLLPRLTTPSHGQDFNFPEWVEYCKALITHGIAQNSYCNLLTFFCQKFGLQSAAVAQPNETNFANICRGIDWATIERNESVRTQATKGTKVHIYDLYNDTEFSRNSDELSKEFGFLKLTESGDVSKGASVVNNFRNIPSYLRSIIHGIHNMYPDMLKDEQLIKVYRLIIFTHGDKKAGLAFRPNESDPKKEWLSSKLLDEADGKTFIGELSKILSPKCIITLYACNTAGTQLSESLLKPDFVKNAESKIKVHNSHIQKLKKTIDARLKSKVAAFDMMRLLQLQDQQRNELLSNAIYSQHLTQQDKTDLQDTSILYDADLTAFQKESELFSSLCKECNRSSSYGKGIPVYGGDPATSSDSRRSQLKQAPPTTFPDRFEWWSCYGIRNIVGKGAFAERLRDRLREKQLQPDVWGHIDAGHTSQNARMRLFTGDGKAFDLVRLIFTKDGGQQTAYPTERQFNWWFTRGNNEKPREHQHAVKKAALCAYESLQSNDQRPFSLSRLITKFRQWAVNDGI